MARHMTVGAALVVAMVTGALAAPLASAAPAAGTAESSAAKAAKTGDVDGDGFGDLAVGAPNGTIAGHAKAGYVSLAYGSKGGMQVERKKGITQNTAGVPGAAEAGDHFGSTVKVGDVDGDGYADLVIGASGEAIGSVKGAGSVTVVFGAKGGLSSHAIAFHAPKPVEGQGFGGQIALGDFDHDGKQDIAVTTGTKVNVVHGAAGLRNTATPAMTALTPPGGGAGVEHTTSGDVNGDGYADLVTVAYEDDPADEGTLGVLPGSAEGLKTTALSKVGLPFAGYTVATGDITGDGKDDVVVDTTFEDGPDDFLMKMFPGTASGLGEGKAYGGKTTPAEIGAIADTDGDGHADLITTDTSANDSDGFHDAGAVTVVPGGDSGLSTTTRTVTLDSDGVTGVREAGDEFGASVVGGDFNADGRADLAVGAPGKYLGTGAVSVLPGSASGPTGTGSILFNPEDLGHPATNADFGAALGQTPGR